MTNRLYLPETEADVLWIKEHGVESNAVVIAITGESQYALEKHQITFIPLCDAVELSYDYETDIDNVKKAYAEVGDGYYPLYYLYSAISTRMDIYRKLIDKYAPRKITAFDNEITIDVCKGFDYVCNPWIPELITYCWSNEITTDIISHPRHNRYHPPSKELPRDVKLYYKRLRYGFTSPFRKSTFNILFVDVGYDWEPVLFPLRKTGCRLFFESTTLNNPEQYWSAILWDKETVPLIHNSPEDHIKAFMQNVDSRINNWFYVSVLAREIKVVCFPNMMQYVYKKLAALCSEHGIKTISYQHGFGYNFQTQPKDEGCDQAHADYFFTYGPGNVPRSDAAFPVKSEIVPVGSTRLSNYRNGTDKGYILWIAEPPHNNTIPATGVESTLRYRIQKTGLGIIAKTRKVIYRPIRYCEICKWIEGTNPANITIDADTPLSKLISEASVIVSDITSPTTWAEAIVSGKPFVLYCDPNRTPIVAEGKERLKQACWLCENERDFLFLLRLSPRATGEGNRSFIHDYILPSENCIEEVTKCAIRIGTMKQ